MCEWENSYDGHTQYTDKQTLTFIEFVFVIIVNDTFLKKKKEERSTFASFQIDIT